MSAPEKLGADHDAQAPASAGDQRGIAQSRAAAGASLLLVLALGVALPCMPLHGGSPAHPAASAAWQLDPNTASAAELRLLPGVGPVLAANIVAYREQAAAPPAFRRLEDLDRVARIGPALLEKIGPHLRFPPADE